MSEHALPSQIEVVNTVTPENGIPTVQVAQYANGNGSMGLTGWWKLAGNFTSMALIAGSFLYLQYTMVANNRSDRIEDREMFKVELREIRTQQDRHIGEIKGSLDANTAATRDLANELRKIKP